MSNLAAHFPARPAKTADTFRTRIIFRPETIIPDFDLSTSSD